MEDMLKSHLENFLSDDNKNQEKKTESDKKKVIKSDFSIIERLDKIIISENGKQLLREQY